MAALWKRILTGTELILAKEGTASLEGLDRAARVACDVRGLFPLWALGLFDTTFLNPRAADACDNGASADITVECDPSLESSSYTVHGSACFRPYLGLPLSSLHPPDGFFFG